MKPTLCPALSIVVPVFNDVRVGRALDSIRDQDCGAVVQVIVVDGGSGRPTMDEIEARDDIVDVLISEPDEGIYDAMNKGVRAASGDVVGILNADDRYGHKGVLARVAEALADPEVDACYGDLVFIDDENRVTRRWKAGRHSRYKWYLGWMPPHPTFFVRRSVYREHGLFDTGFGTACDYELMLRFVIRHGLRMAYIPEVLVKMAPGGASTRSPMAFIRANIESYRAWRANGLAFGFLVPFLKPARKVFQFVAR